MRPAGGKVIGKPFRPPALVGGTRRASDEGSVLPALVVAVLGLVAFTVFTMVPLGSAADERAKARTAADAGALAAASRVKLNVTEVYQELADAPPSRSPRPTPGEVVDRVFRGACDEARDFAIRNGAAAGSVQCIRSGTWEFTVSVRMAQPIEDTTQHASARAAARLNAPGLRVGGAGLCIDVPTGGELCLPRREPASSGSPPAPEPPGSPEPPEPKAPPLPTLEVVLVE
jgi:hypothetical protein